MRFAPSDESCLSCQTVNTRSMSNSLQDRERRLRVESIFHDACGLPAEEREDYLRLNCGDDLALLEEVRSLVRASGEESRLGQLRSATARALTDVAARGRRVGSYEIDRLIGRGGMGSVYLAHRADGQYTQKIAIKLVDMPLTSALFRERFRIERQILADLTHPFIARLLDGGVSEQGEMFLAMEYVDGITITQYCQNNGLSVRERLRLFLLVLSAVQFAHQNLVVHRDLKPDNILVASDGTPRLLDFGTAKLLLPPSADAAFGFTQLGGQAFTPAYASPEQILGQPISVASDIYSLGVLLFVLLSGEHPYEMGDVSTGELLRVVCGVQPPRPSAKSCPFGKIDADLDSIVLKALRKDPRERYSSAQDLATDIQAYLDHRPVDARKGNLRYVAGKFAQRHKLALGSAFLLLAAIVAGIAGVAWQSHLANEQRRKAEARSADLRELSNSLLSELAQALRDIPGTTGAQKILVTNVLAHLDRMAKDAQGDRQTALDLIEAYTQLGNIQGNVYYQNVGDTASAVATFDRAIALAAPMVREHPDDRDLLRAEAAAMEAKGESISQSGDPQASAAALQAAVQLYDRVVALPGVTAALIFEAAIAYETLGNEEAEDSGLADAPAGMAAYRHALEMDERALRIDPDFARVRRGIPLMHIHIGNVILDTEPDHALGEFKLAQQLQKALPEKERAKLSQVRMHGVVLRKIGRAYAEMGRYEEAQESFSQARPVFQRLVDADPKNVGALSDFWRLQSDEALTDLEAGNGDLFSLDSEAQRNHRRAALATFELEADTIRKIIELSPSHAEWDHALAGVQIEIGVLKHHLGLPLEAAVVTERSLKILLQAAAAPHATADDLDAAVDAELQVEPDALRDPVLTLRLAEKGVEMTHHRATRYLLLLAKAYRANGDLARSVQAARDGLALLPPSRPGAPAVRVRTLLTLQLKEPITKK